MPGPLTYAAITLLARDRIGQIRRALAAKVAAGTAHELERHVLYLASQAEEIMKASQPVIEPPVRLYGPPLTDHVSRFTLLGAVGPDLPRYAAYFTPGQRWLFDTLHKGTPDGDRERVLANSTNLVFDFWKRVGPLIDAGISDSDKRIEAKKKMQAYVLGHLCHVAADVLSHPYFESVEARLSTPAVGTTPAVRFMARDDLAGAFDVRIADQFFGRGTDTRTKKWADWFPTPGEVPDAFGQAMSDSITFLYGARVEGLPAFEDAFKKIDPPPPPLSPALIRESVDYFRTIIEIERVWTLPDWLGATAAMFLPLGFAYVGALALPMGKDLTRPLTPADGADASDRRTYESIVYPLAVSSLGPLVSMIIVSASGRGLRAEGVTGWIQAGVSLVATVGFFASLGGAGAARWTLWFALPLALAVAQAIFVLARGARENSRKLLFLGPVVQVVLALVFMLLYRAWLHDGVEELQKDADTRNNLSAFGDFAAWLGIVAVLWFVHALLWRYVFSSSVPDDQNQFASGEPLEYLRLYDDMGLIHDFSAPFTSERLTDLAYPPARRPLLALWWEAKAQAKVQIDIKHDRIVFVWPPLAPAGNQTVFAPSAPITVERFGQLLAAAVTGDQSKGILHVAPARDDEKTMELAPGLVFGDQGDDKTDAKGHGDAVKAPVDVGASEAAAFTLYHTVRPRLAVAMGRSGVAADAIRGEQGSKPGSLLQLATQPITITITTGGALTAAQFTFQVGAGPVSAATPAQSRFVVPGTGATVVFTPGTFVLNDSWTIASNGTATPAGGNTSTGGVTAFVVAQYHATNAGDGTSPLLRGVFRPGDALEIASVAPPREQRIVVQVINETDVIVSSAFTAAIPAGGIVYKRAASDRGVRVRGSSTVQNPALAQGIGPNDLQGTAIGSPFGAQFMAGDVVEIATPTPTRRTIVAVKDARQVGSPPAPMNLLELDAPAPSFAGALAIDRLGDAEADGVPYVADASDVFGDGESVMNDAADLAALFCLAGASRMAPNDTPGTPPGAAKPVHRVYQVFRNWNLDRRRVNEWKLMVSGGAESERRGDFRAAEEAAPVDRPDAAEVFTDAFVAQRQAADAVVRERGWLGVFRSWVDMASRARTDATATDVFRAGEPTNRDLSRAMAYLLDSAEGVTP